MKNDPSGLSVKHVLLLRLILNFTFSPNDLQIIQEEVSRKMALAGIYAYSSKIVYT